MVAARHNMQLVHGAKVYSRTFENWQLKDSGCGDLSLINYSTSFWDFPWTYETMKNINQPSECIHDTVQFINKYKNIMLTIIWMCHGRQCVNGAHGGSLKENHAFFSLWNCTTLFNGFHYYSFSLLNIHVFRIAIKACSYVQNVLILTILSFSFRKIRIFCVTYILKLKAVLMH